MGRAVAWSLLFSPLIGLIVTLTSPRADPRASATTAEVRRLFDQGEKKIKTQDYDEAVRIFEQILDHQPFAPMTNYYLATLYSVKENKDAAFNYLTRAIEQGFKDFAAVNSTPRLAFLRNQPEFREYARNGYRLPAVSTTTDEDVFSKLSRLGKLKADGVITEEEFAAQKSKLLKH